MPQLRKHGAALLILGTRKAESQNRKKSIEKRVLNESGYSQHEDFPDTMTYAPIAEWSTDEVWAYLSRAKAAWGGDFGELFRLYAKASGEECQFITNLAQNSCGGSSKQRRRLKKRRKNALIPNNLANPLAICRG